MNAFVQFSDSTQELIVAVFGCAQDPDIYENQGEIDEGDPRLIVFNKAFSPDSGRNTEE